MICVPEEQDIALVCPITSFAFTLEQMSTNEAKLYQKAKNENSGSTNTFFFSKSAKSLPIDEIKISSSTPCWN